MDGKAYDKALKTSGKLLQNGREVGRRERETER